jgi:hypothetical protein
LESVSLDNCTLTTLKLSMSQLEVGAPAGLYVCLHPLQAMHGKAGSVWSVCCFVKARADLCMCTWSECLGAFLNTSLCCSVYPAAASTNFCCHTGPVSVWLSGPH